MYDTCFVDYVTNSGCSCLDEIKEEKSIYIDETNNEECKNCKKHSFLFTGHDYKFFLKYGLCYECYVKTWE